MPMLRAGAHRLNECSLAFQVLMGQAEVVNWLRSTPVHQAPMRYAGEYKFAGGVVDEGESVAAAGLRELEEEFLAPLNTELDRQRGYGLDRVCPI
eukprot:SAG31_NODE_5031_length_2792_cov_2.309320_3_plen_95_part_00